ncbi:hypothetical protein OAV17_03400 [Gammaproteobacteria bacterium]|nr:hypothetical protein [Gammaproteobacteria bacterium]
MSRATLVDPQPEMENADDINEEANETQYVDEQTEQPQEQSTVPEKYQGKSLEEVVQMHQEAEKLLGRQSGEVGELRKVVDDYISTQAPTQAPQQIVEPEDDIDYFTDPQGAVNRAIENHPKIREAEQYTEQYKKQASLATLQAKHPDMQKILGDPKFAEWIKASKIRTQLFVAADQQYDADAADELFSLWKERKVVAQQTANVEKQARKQTLKAASTGNARGSSQGTRKKVYRRADIIKLMRTDPDRYTALADEIMAAYAEGRVK